MAEIVIRAGVAHVASEGRNHEINRSKKVALTLECFSKWGSERFSKPSGTREPLMACWPTQAIIWEMLMKDPAQAAGQMKRWGGAHATCEREYTIRTHRFYVQLLHLSSRFPFYMQDGSINWWIYVWSGQRNKLIIAFTTSNIYVCCHIPTLIQAYILMKRIISIHIFSWLQLHEHKNMLLFLKINWSKIPPQHEQITAELITLIDLLWVL